MSSKRKSFVLHRDSIEILDDLTDEQAGKLFKAIKAYHDGEVIELDALIKIAFAPFKNQFARDDEKYQKIVERNKNNGLKGGRPKTEVNPEEPNKPSGLSGNPDNPQKADSDSKSVSDSDSKSESKEISRFAEFWDLYGKKVDSKKCEAKFKKLSKKDVDQLFEALPKYIASTPEKQFRKNPLTWLNGKCWNDEIQNQIPLNSQGVNYVGNNFDKPEGWT